MNSTDNSAAIFPLWHEPHRLCRGQVNVAGITEMVGNVKIAMSENIALLLHPRVDVPCSLVVMKPDLGWQIVPS